MGKTVLLDRWVSEARHRRWAAIRIQASPVNEAGPLQQLLARSDELIGSFPKKVAKSAAEALRATISGFSIQILGTGGSVDLQPPASPDSQSVSLAHDAIVRTLGQTAQTAHKGVLIAVDEIQGCSGAELETFARSMQAMNSASLPVVYAFAGLPNSQTKATSLGASTFIERVAWRPIGRLSPAETRTATEVPLQQQGRTIDNDALELLTEWSDGFPFMIQLGGFHTLEAARRQKRVTLEHVRAAEATITDDLETGIYNTMWNRASPKEKQFLHAMATTVIALQHLTVPSSEVYRRLEMTSKQASPYRARLIEKGIIESEGHTLRFVFPSYESFIINRKAVQDPDIIDRGRP